MKVIIHKGKHCSTAFPETDAGWLMFFNHMKNDEGYYYGISSGEDVREAEKMLKQRVDLKNGQKMPDFLKDQVEESIKEIPRYERELVTAKRQRELCELAYKKKDAKAAKNLAYARHDYEYEDFEILEVREK